MKQFKDFLEIEILKRLFTSLGISQGYIKGKDIFDETKIKTKSRGEPGDRIKITWQGRMKGIIDYGYIFTLPGFDSDDIYITGIVHIPYPAGGEKTQPEPEWWSLAELSGNKDIKEILIYK